MDSGRRGDVLHERLRRVAARTEDHLLVTEALVEETERMRVDTCALRCSVAATLASIGARRSRSAGERDV